MHSYVTEGLLMIESYLILTYPMCVREDYGQRASYLRRGGHPISTIYWSERTDCPKMTFTKFSFTFSDWVPAQAHDGGRSLAPANDEADPCSKMRVFSRQTCFEFSTSSSFFSSSTWLASCVSSAQS